VSKRPVFGTAEDLSRPSKRAEALDEERYNVRLELARGTELSMNEKAAELGVRGPKGVIVYALTQIGVTVDERDRKVLRRMKRSAGGAEPSKRPK